MANIINQNSMFKPDDEIAVKRKRKLAEQLMKQGEQPQGTEVVSGVAVQQSPWAALARALTQGVGGYMEGQADKQESDIAQAKRDRYAQAIQTGNLDALAQGSPEEQQIALKQKLEQQLLAQKANMGMSGGNIPAPIKIANEIQKAINEGDYNRANLLAQTAKMYDRGINPYSPDGIQPMQGYGDALSGIRGQIKNSEAYQGKIGENNAENAIALQNQTTQMPRLEQVAQELSELGKTATYTKAGQVRDEAIKQLGMKPTEGAVARTEYISKVDNEILPLLRQTFGAQFTQKEGESLKATLGDPNKTAEEKDAVLRSFIDQKRGQIDVTRNKVYSNNPMPLPNQQPIGKKDAVINHLRSKGMSDQAIQQFLLEKGM